MKGIAQLTVSKENIVEAVQMWLDKQWTVDAPVVTDITQTHSGGHSDQFRIDLQSNKSFVGVKE